MDDFKSSKRNDNTNKRKAIRRTKPLCTEELLAENLPHLSATGAGAAATVPTTTTTTVSIEMGRKSLRDKDREKKKRGVMKERWLLTRKTWKYMADTGRRLLPEGAQNRPEDVPKIEEYFQHVCRNEPKFVLWRRKCSYPGAISSLRNSKWRIRNMAPKAIRLGPDPPDEQTQNVDLIINMLRSYLNLNDEKKTSMMLSAKTVRPDQTESPSAKRPPTMQTFFGKDSSLMKANELTEQINELLERLRSYSQYCGRSILSPDKITTDILEDKVLLKKIYTELKKQQLHRILGKHSSRPPNLTHSSSLTSLWNFRRDTGSDSTRTPSITDLPGKTLEALQNLAISQKNVTQLIEKKFATSGTQTDFIPLHTLQRMAKDYEFQKKEERQARQSDEEAEKNFQQHHSRRKSSIDNEDVSQSVSDTIKRYLRMARKKSVADDHANRFKRVNYDRNLRNIRAKGEMVPPGMDEGPHKATQTLDAWPVIALGYIRGSDNTVILAEAHADWRDHLQQRIQRKEEYEEQLRQKDQQKRLQPQPNPISSPTHSTGIFHSGTQFFSNLWHGHHNNAHDTSSSSEKQNHDKETQTLAMQKSKSSSNVGQFVSKKIWRSRSKSQPRVSSPSKPEWTPQGNCIWTSANGKRLILSDLRLYDLTEIERKVLHRVAIEKINQLNIGVNVTAPGETAAAPSKPQKRRPLLIKRKALTTSFFDSGKKSDSKGTESSGLVFGISLEKCVDNDNRMHKDAHNSDKRSRDSIISLLGSSPKIGSCESLPLRSNYLAAEDGRNLLISPPIQPSRSQSDVRRTSQDEDDLLASAPPMTQLGPNQGEQIPALVTACIKHLEEHGLHTVGIFRVSTSKKRVRQLKEDFDRGEITYLDTDVCPHDVATILKEYLRNLPEPLICRNLYKAFVRTQKIRNRRLQLEALSHLVQLLPVAHRDTLYALLKFLAKIVRASDDIISHEGTVLLVGNKMDSSNLATVFAPNILRCTDAGQNTTEQEIDDQVDVINVIRTMIDHCEELFRVPAELLDEIYTNMIDTFPQQLNYLCEKRDMIENEDMDSCASNTPANSPPPTGVHPPLSFSKPLTQEQSKHNPRRIYSREDCTHENAAKGDLNNSGTNLKKRERVSKMKYVDSETEISRRRRRDRSTCDPNMQSSAQGNAASTGAIPKHQYDHFDEINDNILIRQSGDESHSKNPSGGLSQTGDLGNDNSFRRLSAPFVMDHTGVVTAKLKIPVQMQSNNSNQQTTGFVGVSSEGTDSTNRGSSQFDLSDIPFIEDNEGQFRQAPITGTLFFGGRKNSATSNTYQIPIAYEGRILNTSSESSPTSPESIKLTFQTVPSTSVDPENLSITTKKTDSEKSMQKKYSGSRVLSPTSQDRLRGENIPPGAIGRDTEQCSVGYSSSESYGTVHKEPKLTTSITNIGGAVLRSKTADFERMLMQNKKHKTGTLEDVLRSANDKNFPENSSSGTNNNNKSKRPSQGTIYKRQELISSAKRSSK